MPINGFTVGRDVTLSITTSNGPLSLSLITEFQSKQGSTEQIIRGLDGVPNPIRFFAEWSGSFNLEREDSTVDDYFAGLEANYYAGISEQGATIFETIQEVDGSLTQYQYIGVLLKLDDAGSYKGDATVKQSISFLATRRLKLA